jgi:hypothetical protein
MLPGVAEEALRRHLEAVRRQHQQDLAQGLGQAPLPDALARMLEDNMNLTAFLRRRQRLLAEEGRLTVPFGQLDAS